MTHRQVLASGAATVILTEVQLRLASCQVLGIICYSDEAWFHLHGHISSQNNRYVTVVLLVNI